MSEEKTLLAEWQERLGLRDWRIRLCAGLSPAEIDGDNDGTVVYRTATKIARIDILAGRYYGVRTVPYDFERILVHELLHLKFALLDESGNDLQDKLVHQLVDDMARALVCAKRGALRIGLREADDGTEA